ncbi:MAG: hypothetical protein Q9P14_00505 [candidate division KSB1 bacterium]|nr:hypothetical protein [candidate division KSB1 bacterium]
MSKIGQMIENESLTGRRILTAIRESARSFKQQARNDSMIFSNPDRHFGNPTFVPIANAD